MCTLLNSMFCIVLRYYHNPIITTVIVMHKEYRVVLQITQTAHSDKQGNYGTWLNCKHIAVSDHKDLQNHRNRNQLSQHGN